MKKLSLLLVTAAFVALLVPAAWGQFATVKGTVKGPDGKPMPGVVVQLVDKSTGRKYTLKSDKKGQIFSIGVSYGTYDVDASLDGKLIWQVGGFPVKGDEENDLDINIKSQQQQAQELQQQAANQPSSLTPEQRKALEEQAAQQQKVAAENQKIKGLNEMLKEAKAASDAGNYDQAKQIMQQATQLDPTKEILWLKLADAELNSAGKTADAAQKKTTLQEAVDSYNKALKLTTATKPDLLGAIYNNMGQAYAGMGNIDEAAKSYDQAATADVPHAGMYYFNEGAVLTNSGKYDAAIAAFDKAIQADPTKADAYYQKGVNLLGKATTKPDGSVVAPPGTSEAFNKYLELDPNGKYADQAKQMLAMIGGKVETSFGKGKSKK